MSPDATAQDLGLSGAGIYFKELLPHMFVLVGTASEDSRSWGIR